MQVIIILVWVDDRIFEPASLPLVTISPAEDLSLVCVSILPRVWEALIFYQPFSLSFGHTCKMPFVTSHIYVFLSHVS